MAQAADVFSQFKTVFFTGDGPQLGPQRRPGALGLAELDRQFDAFSTAVALEPRLKLPLRSAALLWHDHLDASHDISQGLETREGSWLHGIMHRREPDYGNAQYWFQRVGSHPAFPALATRVNVLLGDDQNELARRLAAGGKWSAEAFIDECERAEQGGDAVLTAVLRQIQAAEFDTFLAHLFNPTEL